MELIQKANYMEIGLLNIKNSISAVQALNLY
jgi:hypothetical protein